MSLQHHLPRAARAPEDLGLSCNARAPELGPRILFFSGGTALRPLSRALKRLTHNSIHLITAFDSGGSSAQLRRAFAMPGIGDLRNRIMALADESVLGNTQIYELFAHRLPSASAASALRSELDSLAVGAHVLVRELAEPMHRIVQTMLRYFLEHMPAEFDLRGANVGNLLLAGGYLSRSRDLESVLLSFSDLLDVRGVVRPIVEDDVHLCADLVDGTRVVGQHRLTGKEVAPIGAAVGSLSLVRGLADTTRAHVSIGEKVRRSIEAADLICYPMGSFYTSVVANLLPAGVGRAIAAAGCPRVYVPNTGHDPEQRGMSVVDTVEALHAYARADAGGDLPLSRVLDIVLLDNDASNYTMRVEAERLERMGLQVITSRLVSDASRPLIHPQRLTEALLALT